MKENSNVNDIFGNLFQSITDPYTKLFPCSAIWISEIREKVFVGDKVEITGEKLIKNTDTPTHKITALNGTLSGSKYEIELINLSNNETKIIEL